MADHQHFQQSSSFHIGSNDQVGSAVGQYGQRQGRSNGSDLGQGRNSGNLNGAVFWPNGYLNGSGTSNGGGVVTSQVRKFLRN